ncbi:gluconate transporter [Parvularcula sp. ZS-1/3]|uniref:Gluconate transporter n=1 Tax=Parvularcula mediterranea TaxID=2732508 RepID=A0A7Y3W544_9PROT|nr:gluconate:H+ symporter [Parvularcula mediterranea]NNU16239.1 gluconate transporter [Parvularcula mediterranea]
MEGQQAIIATGLGVAVLLLLILRFRMNAFVALLSVALGTALLAGLPVTEALAAVQAGMGGTLGFIAPIVGLGALFGAMLEASGGIEALGRVVGDPKKLFRTQVTVAVIGLVASTPVFFDVGLLILLPLVIGLARAGAKPALAFGLPLAAGLAVGHGFVPPTPGPMAIADLIGAEVGWVAIFGILTGLVAVIVSGPVFASFLASRGALPEGKVQEPQRSATATMPPGQAMALIVLPLLLILLAAAWPGEKPGAVTLIGHPFTALIIACAAAALVLRTKDEEARKQRDRILAGALLPTGSIILVTGAGGSFKQVLVETGAGEIIGQGVAGLALSPVIASFVLALILRVSQGSATVAMVTASGLAAPIIAAADPSAAGLGVLTIAIAAGATGFSHVNDSGFWLVRELFGLTTGETLRTWTLLTGIIAIVGLIACLILYPIVA